jgi:hypothetical protein
MVDGEAVRVRVTTTGTAELVFAKALPGGVHRMTVSATATATAVRG